MVSKHTNWAWCCNNDSRHVNWGLAPSRSNFRLTATFPSWTQTPHTPFYEYMDDSKTELHESVGVAANFQERNEYVPL